MDAPQTTYKIENLNLRRSNLLDCILYMVWTHRKPLRPLQLLNAQMRGMAEIKDDCKRMVQVFSKKSAGLKSDEEQDAGFQD